MKDWKPSVTKPVIKEVTNNTNKVTNEVKSVSNKLDKTTDNKKEEDMAEIDYNKIIDGVTKQMQEIQRQKEETAREIQKQVEPTINPIQEEVNNLKKELTGIHQQISELSFEKLRELCDSGVLEACKIHDERLDKLEKEREKTPGSKKKTEEKTLDGYTAQEKYDSIKESETALKDLDNIYIDRFAQDAEYRKKALDELPSETFVEMGKNKQIEDKLNAMCTDEACRVDIEERIKKAKESSEKKLFKKS